MPCQVPDNLPATTTESGSSSSSSYVWLMCTHGPLCSVPVFIFALYLGMFCCTRLRRVCFVWQFAGDAGFGGRSWGDVITCVPYILIFMLLCWVEMSLWTHKHVFLTGCPGSGVVHCIVLSATRHDHGAWLMFCRGCHVLCPWSSVNTLSYVAAMHSNICCGWLCRLSCCVSHVVWVFVVMYHRS